MHLPPPPVSFRPALLDCLRQYTWKRLARDTSAGLVVGIVALPLAMAFAIASGVPPQAGLFTAIIAGFLISALGGSRTQIGGPTGAFVAIVYGIVIEYGVEKLAICTLMAGVILLIMGLTRLGRMIKFIPYPVTMGFTSGIAVIIFSGQIKDFLGLSADKVPPGFLDKWLLYIEQIGTTQWPTLLIAAVSLGILLFWPARWGQRVPASLVVLILATLAVRLAGVDAATIQSRFGGIPQGFPPFQLPPLSLDLFKELLMPATAIALLGAIESLLSAVVADGLTDDQHDSNQELMAQGIANIIVPFFGGIPATGAIARTATNIRNGATSPVSGIIHALTLLIIILVAAPLAGGIPLAALAAILINVSLKMGEWHYFKRLLHLPRSDATVFLTTFGLTVLADLVVAVEVGMVLAAMLFIKRLSELSDVTAHHLDNTQTSVPDRDLYTQHLPKDTEVYRVSGAFFFGTADKLESACRRSQTQTKNTILIMDQAIDIDATGLNALENLHARLSRQGRRIILCGVRPNVLETLRRSGFLQRLGEHNLADTVFHALRRTREPNA